MSGPGDFGTENLVGYICALEELVEWLAIPYQGNDPIFPLSTTVTDVRTGQSHTMPLESNVRLANTWAYVMHGRHAADTGLTEEVPGGEEEDNGKH